MEKISQNPLFAHVTADSIARMMTCFQIEQKTFAEKDTVMTYHTAGEYIGLLLDGAISVNRISIDGTLDMLEYLEDTGVFGAPFAFSHSQDAFTVLCERDCTVLLIEKHHLTKRCENACHHHTQVVENLMELMAEQVVRLTEKVDILSHRSIRGKLLCYFRLQSTKQNALTFRLPFSLLALANYLCIDRSAMMRELKKMKEEGLVALDGRAVSLL